MDFISEADTTPITDSELLERAKAGSDRACAFCQALNEFGAQTCGFCGAVRSEGTQLVEENANFGSPATSSEQSHETHAGQRENTSPIALTPAIRKAQRRGIRPAGQASGTAKSTWL